MLLGVLLSLGPGCERYVPVGHLEALGAGGDAGAGGTEAAPARVPWAADHETGDLEQWLSDGAGRRFVQGGGEVQVSQQQAHSGAHALLATISASDGELHQAVMGRDVELMEGRYSAWYYLPASPVSDAAVIMKLSNRPTLDRYDIDLQARGGERPRLRLYAHDRGDFITEPAAVSFPIAQWVQVQVLYRSTPDSNGRLVVFQDGQQVLDSGPRSTAQDTQVVFFCGITSRNLAPSPFQLFVDDARVEAAEVP